MDEEDDDFYGAGDQRGQQDYDMSGQDPIKSEDQNMSEEEEEDSDDDVQFTLEKPATVKTESAPVKQASKAISVEPSTSKPTKTEQPTKQESIEPTDFKQELLHNGKEGKDYPEHRTSDINLDDDPTWPADGKKIMDLDIEADLAEHSKPWRLPGTDVTDFFNYGFDEYTWTLYCAKQRDMAKTITEQKEQDAQMMNALGGMPGGGEGGMPDMQAMMNAMMSQMMGGGAGGMGPDFSQMMSMQQPAAGFNAAGGFPGAQGGNSPMPQNGQAFQPPLGPSAMDGFEQQQGHGGQGGGRGRGRRGRGYY